MFTKTLMRGVALASLSSLAACGGGERPATLGGSYIMTRYPGLSNVPGSTAAEWGPKQYDQLVELNRQCDRDIRAQRPGMLGPVLKEGALMALGDAIGVGLGALGAFGKAVKFKDYAIYGAGAGGGAGIAGAVSREEIARRYAEGQCMALQVYWANSRDNQLNGVGVIPWVGGTNAKRIERPTHTVGSPSSATVSAPPQQLQPPQ